MRYISFLVLLPFTKLYLFYERLHKSKFQKNLKIAIKFAISKKEDSSLESLLFLEM